MKETKIVHGILLEKRLCACGCGHGFFVRPESEVLYRSEFCSDDGTGRGGRFPEGKVSINAIARMEGVLPRAVYQWVRESVVPSHRLEDGTLCFDPEEVKAALEARPRGRRGSAQS